MIGEFWRPDAVEPKMTAPAAAVEDLTSEHWKDDFRQLLCNKKFNFELFKTMMS
jgi:hypothetical protein